MVGQFKYERVNEDRYKVYHNGQYIGDVYKGWWRLGGAGWSHSRRQVNTSAGKTRQQAAANLLHDVKYD